MTRAITTANASLEFDTTIVASNSCFKIDDNHFINFWSGLGEDGYTQVFEINTTTRAITTINSNLEFDIGQSYSNSCYKIDDNHFINFRSGIGYDGFVEVFEVNTTTRAVTTANIRIEFDPANNGDNSCYPVDSNHFINFWRGFDNDGYVEVFEVNTTSRVVSTTGNRLEFDTYNGNSNSCYKIDDNHFVNFWRGGLINNNGYVQVFEVNTTTRAVTTINNSLEFETQGGLYNSCYQVDDNHFINFWAGSDNDGYVQVFEVNTTTRAVTTAGINLEFDTISGIQNSCYQVDSNHFVNFWAGSDSNGYVQVFEVNTTTRAVTTAGINLEFDTISGIQNSCYQVDSNHFINFWVGSDSDGYVQVFEIDVPVETDTGKMFLMF